jgi:hypothetical protein
MQHKFANPVRRPQVKKEEVERQFRRFEPWDAAGGVHRQGDAAAVSANFAHEREDGVVRHERGHVADAEVLTGVEEADVYGRGGEWRIQAEDRMEKEDRRQEAGDRRKETGGRRQKAEERRPLASLLPRAVQFSACALVYGRKSTPSPRRGRLRREPQPNGRERGWNRVGIVHFAAPP